MGTLRLNEVGGEFSYGQVAEGWLLIVDNGEYDSEKLNIFVDALTEAQVDRVNEKLPDGWCWEPKQPVLYGPIEDDSDFSFDDLVQEAAEFVSARIDEIESRTFGTGKGHGE